MSMIPMGGNKVSINPWLMDNYPDGYLSMGLTAERLAKRFGITRQQADEFSLNSHKKAMAAIQGGRFEDEIVPVPVSFTTPNGSKPKRIEIIFKVDEGPRADTTMEALAALKPAFHAKGSVTAGNSSQTSDGAAATVVMSSEKPGNSASNLWRDLWHLPRRAICRKKWAWGRCMRFPKS